MLRTAAVAAAICGTAAATSSSTTPSSAFVSSMPLAQSGRVAACTRSGGVRTMRSMAEVVTANRIRMQAEATWHRYRI